jgi:uncharacterized repeat protein (TIGR03803 family)
MTVASFNSATTGYNPYGSLVMDTSGNLYGTTRSGPGTVFGYNVSTKSLTTLANLSSSMGTVPNGLIRGPDGNLYGTTSASGAGDAGTIVEFNLTTKTLTSLASFDVNTNGGGPQGTLVADANGNFYGVTLAGANGDGNIFEYVASTHSLVSLFSFSGTDGRGPEGGLVMDAHGNLYGTTSGGGAHGLGTVFEYSPSSGVMTTLYSFGGLDGAAPQAGLLIGADGNLYGTTQGGGTLDGSGTIFELSLPEPGCFAVIGLATLGYFAHRKRNAA